ncbi:helix-turn-helix transcriptional regulator [Corynebacterium testudinoris]|uniref:Putative transcriptional regulator n=1 Tax=Corynebacterium testudinoris TaxID=136857 RepID=A0A0G3HD75_9CORY|nr:putative transcriptional regulator [Corynebacterium testudinoris]MBX8996911.1 helix-turn-helix transcriptional regulator [Corynebacterium testudinoris]
MFVQSPMMFADFVRSQRVQRGMTQQDLGSQAGMSRRWVQDLESGKLVPSLEATLRVASAFGYELHLEPMPSASPLDALFDELA